MIDTETLNRLKELRSQGFPDEMYDIINGIYKNVIDGKIENCHTSDIHLDFSIFYFTGEFFDDYPKGNSLFDALNGVHKLLVPDSVHNDCHIWYTEYDEIGCILSALKNLDTEKIIERFNSLDFTEEYDEGTFGNKYKFLETLIKDYFMFLEFYQKTENAGKNVLVIFP